MLLDIALFGAWGEIVVITVSMLPHHYEAYTNYFTSSNSHKLERISSMCTTTSLTEIHNSV